MPAARHILFLPAWYPYNGDAMFGLFVKRHAEVVSENALVSVLYFAPSAHKSNYGWCVTKSKNLNEYIYYAKQCKIPVFVKIIRWMTFLRAMHSGYKMIRRDLGKPDISHVHVLTRMGIIAQIIKIRFSIPFVITEHWSRYLSFPGTYKGFIRKCLTKWVCKNACEVSVVTKNLGDALIHHGLVKDYSIVNNVVDTSIFKPMSNTSKQRDEIRIIHISCFEDRSKNISGLISAFHELLSIKQNIYLDLVGDGEDKTMMEELVRELNLGSLVHFCGVLDGNALAHKLAESSFLVVSSRYENMPVVIPEAFACGIPVLATNVGGISEWVNHSNGLLIEASSTQALVNGMIQMSDSYFQFNPELIRSIALEHFSSKGIWDQFSSLYQKCITNGD